MTLNTDPRSRRLRWSGILAGLVMGAVTTMTILAVGAVITSLTGLTLTGTGIQALIWTAVAALVGAYAAGLTAVHANAPSAMDDKAAMLGDDAKLTGLVTGGLLVLLTSWMAASGISSVAGAAGNALGGIASGLGGAVATAGSAAGTVGAKAAQSNQVQDFFSNITPDDVEYLVARNSDLNQAQIDATAKVVSSVINQAKFSLSDVDINDLDLIYKQDGSQCISFNKMKLVLNDVSQTLFLNPTEQMRTIMS